MRSQRDLSMKINNFLLAFTLCASLQLHASEKAKEENKIQSHVTQILEWAATEKKDDEAAFNKKKDSSPIFNPTEKDTDIVREAKKRAKAQLFPEQAEVEKTTQSYWQMYAPQFMQDATSATSGYIATWIPQSIKDTVNKWSTKKKIAVASAIIGSLVAIGYNKDTIIAFINNAITPANPKRFLSEEEKRQLGVPITVTLQESDLANTDKINFFKQAAQKQHTILEQLKTPLANPFDEKKAQEIADTLVANHSDFSWGRTSIDYGLLSRSQKTLEERIESHAPVTIDERARLLYLEKLGINPEYYIKTNPAHDENLSDNLLNSKTTQKNIPTKKDSLDPFEDNTIQPW